MRLFRAIAAAAALFLAGSGSAWAACSTVIPTQPATSGTLSSAPIRQNFASTYSDINNILQMFVGATAPPSPCTGQFWRNTSTAPNRINQWDGAAWVLWGLLDTTAHTFSSALSAGTVIATPPITASFSSGTVTLGINLNSRFAVVANQLALASIPVGNLMANATAGSAEPGPTTATAWLDRWCGSAAGAFVFRSSAWGCGSFSATAPITVTSPGGVVTYAFDLSNANTWTGVQTFNAGRLALAGSSSGTTILNAAAVASGTMIVPSGTDTLMGKATVDTPTNKTFDTAGAGNSLLIAGVAITGNTGTGSTVARDTNPVFNFTAAVQEATAGAAFGPSLNILRSNAAGAASDQLGAIRFFGKDTAGSFVEYARPNTRIAAATVGAASGEYVIQTMVSGTLADRMVIRNGATFGSPTGGDQGAGRINVAGGYYVNGSALNFSHLIGTIGSAQFPTGPGVITGPMFANAIASSIFVNSSTSAAAPAFVAPGSLTLKASPAAADKIVITDSAASDQLKYTTASALAATGTVGSVNGQTGAVKIPANTGLRVTLTTGTPYMTADVAGATRVYATPTPPFGRYVTIYDGTNLVPTDFGEVFQDTTDATKSPAAVVPNANYDIVCWVDTGPTNRCTRTDYWKKASTFTVTIATPAVFTWNSHGLAAGTPVVLSTTGTLPTGIGPGTTYFVVSPTTNTFSVALTVGGSALATSGTQSGTHTATAGDDLGTVSRASGGNVEMDLTTGIYLNKNLVTNGPAALRGTVIGSVRSNSSGTISQLFGTSAAGGGAACLCVFSFYNADDIAAEVNDSTGTWDQTSTTIGPFHGPLSSDGGVAGGLNNRVSILSGLQRVPVTAEFVARVNVTSNAISNLQIGLGLNQTTAFDRSSYLFPLTAAGFSIVIGVRIHYKPMLGFNNIYALQTSDGSHANTFNGANSAYLMLKTRM